MTAADPGTAAKRAAARRARVCRRRKRRKRRPTMVTVAFDSARAQRALVACGRLSEQEASDPDYVKEVLADLGARLFEDWFRRALSPGIPKAMCYRGKARNGTREDGKDENRSVGTRLRLSHPAWEQSVPMTWKAVKGARKSSRTKSAIFWPIN